MTSTSGPRRAAAVAGITVALAAGATAGLVAADLERHTPVATTAAPSVEPLPQAAPSISPSPATPSLTPAPAPQSTRPGQQPHTTTRAS